MDFRMETRGKQSLSIENNIIIYFIHEMSRYHNFVLIKNRLLPNSNQIHNEKKISSNFSFHSFLDQVKAMNGTLISVSCSTISQIIL